LIIFAAQWARFPLWRLSPRDPVEWLFHDVLAGAYFDAGHHEEGLTARRRLVALYPDYCAPSSRKPVVWSPTFRSR
jgi:predicted NAD/FAD-binding protein